MKSKEELNELKEEFEALNKKLRELTEEELEQVAGGNEDFGSFLQQRMETYPDMMQEMLDIMVNGTGQVRRDPPAFNQNTVGHNIKNDGTEGYSQQRVNTNAISPKYLE